MVQVEGVKTPSGRNKLWLQLWRARAGVIGAVDRRDRRSNCARGPVYRRVRRGTGEGTVAKKYLMTWHQLRRCQCIIGVEHFGCKLLHDWFGCEVEVAEHLVGAPTAKDLDDVGVDLGNQ